MPAKKKFRPVIEETAQSSAPIRGRGASWSPANRFERLHVDLTDMDVVDDDADACDERRDRPVSADREKVAYHARLPRSAREISKPSGDHNQESAGYSRYRPLVRIGKTQRGRGESFRDFSRAKFAAITGAANV